MMEKQAESGRPSLDDDEGKTKKQQQMANSKTEKDGAGKVSVGQPGALAAGNRSPPPTGNNISSSKAVSHDDTKNKARKQPSSRGINVGSAEGISRTTRSTMQSAASSSEALGRSQAKKQTSSSNLPTSNNDQGKGKGGKTNRSGVPYHDNRQPYGTEQALATFNGVTTSNLNERADVMVYDDRRNNSNNNNNNSAAAAFDLQQQHSQNSSAMTSDDDDFRNERNRDTHILDDDQYGEQAAHTNAAGQSNHTPRGVGVRQRKKKKKRKKDKHDQSGNSDSRKDAATGRKLFDANDDKDADDHDARRSPKMSIEHDIYSLLFVTNIWTKTFWICFFVFLVQIWIMVLLIIDLLKKKDFFAQKNELRAPVIGNDTTVILAQYTAIFIALFSQDDIMNTIALITTTFDREYMVRQMNLYAESSDYTSTRRMIGQSYYWKWILCNASRCVEGILATVVSFLFIVQSDNVLDMFMNFAAVEFVSHLDNMVFDIALQGFFGEGMASAADMVTHISLPITRPDLAWVQRVIFGIMLTVLIVGLGLTQTSQSQGVFLYDSSCLSMTITLGNGVLPLENGLHLDGTRRNTTFFAPDVLNATVSENGGGQVLGEAPDLIYSFFSGEYIGMDNTLPFNRRPRYYQHGLKDDPTAGMFYYCKDEQAWVFTIPAMKDNLPEATKRRCQHGWLLQSPVTEAASLEDAPLTGWNMWTGTIDTMDIQVECNECYRDSDCGLQNGRCNHKTRFCECNEGWSGWACDEEEVVCPQLAWIEYGTKSDDFYSDSSYSTLNNPANLSEYAFLYGRPAYWTWTNYSSSIDFYELIFYVGSRWVWAVWPTEEFDELYILESIPIHAYWHLDRGNKLIAFSEPTTSFYPTHINWYWTRVSASSGNSETVKGFDLFGANFLAENAKFECVAPVYQPTTDYAKESGLPLSTCGIAGVPNTTTLTCDCNSGYGGIHCEFDSAGPYVEDQSRSFVENFESNEADSGTFVKNFYHELYWSQYSDEELYEILLEEGAF